MPKTKKKVTKKRNVRGKVKSDFEVDYGTTRRYTVDEKHPTKFPSLNDATRSVLGEMTPTPNRFRGKQAKKGTKSYLAKRQWGDPY